MLRYIVGTHQLSGLVDADIIQIVPAVRTLEHSAVHFLLLFFRPQNFFNGWQQRKGAEAGFCFEHILADSHRLAIDRVLNDLVLDGDGLLILNLKIVALLQVGIVVYTKLCSIFQMFLLQPFPFLICRLKF